MRTPLDNWNNIKRGYLFGSKTFYSNFHLGTDYLVGCGTSVYAPLSGQATSLFGKQGGNTIHLAADGKIFRFMHLKSPGASGAVKEGSVIGYVGTTGLSTACHLHIDISKGKLDINNHNNFIDPEIYFKAGQKGEQVAGLQDVKLTPDEVKRIYGWIAGVEPRPEDLNGRTIDIIPELMSGVRKSFELQIKGVVDSQGEIQKNLQQLNAIVEKNSLYTIRPDVQGEFAKTFKQLGEIQSQLDDIKKAITSGQPLPAEDQKAIGFVKKIIEWIDNFFKKK